MGAGSERAGRDLGIPRGTAATTRCRLWCATPLGTDPLALRRVNQLEADRAEMRGLPPKRRDIAPRLLTDAVMKAMRVVPEVFAEPIDPSLELEPVTDHDLPDDPAMDIHEGDMP